MKLTSYQRDAIIKALVDKAYTEREAVLKTAMDWLADDVYKAAFSSKVRSQMLSLPEGWLPRAKTIRARLGGLDFGHEIAKPVLVPSDKREHGNTTSFLLATDSDCPLGKRWAVLAEEQSRCEMGRKTTKAEVRAVVESCTTVAKLLKTWPEIRSVVEAACQIKTPTLLPALRITELNKTLGFNPAT